MMSAGRAFPDALTAAMPRQLWNRPALPHRVNSRHGGGVAATLSPVTGQVAHSAIGTLLFLLTSLSGCGSTTVEGACRDWQADASDSSECTDVGEVSGGR